LVMKWFSKGPKLEFSEISLSENAKLFIRSTPEQFRMNRLVSFEREVTGASWPKLDANGISKEIDSIIVSLGAVSGLRIFKVISRDELLVELFVNRLLEIVNGFMIEVGGCLLSDNPLSRKSLETLKDLLSKCEKICEEISSELKDLLNSPSGALHSKEWMMLMLTRKNVVEMSIQLKVQMLRTADYIDAHLEGKG
jgi:hypothetical protein